MSNQFDFWNKDASEIDPDETLKQSGAEVALPPQFPESAAIPDKITATWVKAQLSPTVWKQHTRARINPQLIAEMAEIAAKTPSKRGLMSRFGFAVTTYYNWERKAALGEQPYALWHMCVMHGFSNLEEELLDNIRGHAAVDWKAAAWYLARLNRDEFGEKQSSTQISVDSGGVSKVTINRITDDDAMQIARIMGEIGALPAGPGDDGVVDGEVVED